MEEYQFNYDGKTVAVPDELVQRIKADVIRAHESDLRDAEVEGCRMDVINYLKEQDDAYFAERSTTKETVLADKELIDTLTLEHHKCVYQFGNDRGWSVADCCDNEPGFYPPDGEG